MVLGKKGMFFTIIVIALLSLFFVSYTLYSVISDRSSVDKRVKTMNNFIFSVEKDLPRQLYISGFRIIFLLENKIVETGQYIQNLNETFENAFFNGIISGEEQMLMVGAKFSDIGYFLEEKAKSINVNIKLLSPTFFVSQEDPWHVKFFLNASLFVEDKAGLALWNKTVSVSAFVPVAGFEDPIYIIETNGVVSNKINRTIYSIFVQGSDVSNLLSHVQGGYYIWSQDAPSFLNRLAGNFQASENGIESLVYLPKLSSQGISIRSKSVVDHIYFSDSNPASQNVAGMPSWFRLDSGHLSVYQVS